MPSGAVCQAAPLRDGAYCLFHDPDSAEEVARGRRAGGVRRRRETTLELAYGLEGLDTVAGIRRLLDLVVADALALDSGIGRLRILIAAGALAAKLLEVADLEVRLEAIEVVHRRGERGEGPAGDASGPLYRPASEARSLLRVHR